MPQTTLTIVAEVERAEDLKARLGSSRDALIRHFAQIQALHFARLLVVDEGAALGLAPQLVLALVFDGPPRDCVALVASKAETELEAIYAHCPGYANASPKLPLVQYLLARNVDPGLFYRGAEDVDVPTIRAMADVRTALRRRLDVTMRHGGSAESKFSLAAEAHREYLDMPDTTARISIPVSTQKSKRAIAVRTILWVASLALLALAISAIPVIVAWLLGLGWWSLALGLLPLGIPILELRRREIAVKKEQDGRPVTLKDEHLKQVVAEEDLGIQNALTHCSIVDGLFSRVLLSLVFWAIGLRVRFVDGFAGSLGGITSIHFGRWVFIDEGKPQRRLIFMADYDGSWESYLGEFVDRAAQGLSAVWGNTKGFPATYFLINQGARDEQRFKTWTRAGQVSTPVWYSAYDQETLRNIENNLRIVRGVRSMPAPPEEPAWLASL